MRRLGLAAGSCLLLAACGQPAAAPAAEVQPSASAQASARPIVTSSVPASAASDQASPAGLVHAAASPANGSSASTGGAAANSGAPSTSMQVNSAPAGSGSALANTGATGTAAAPGNSGAAGSAPAAVGVALAAMPPSKRIGPLSFISQTLNNCGPASIAEVLNFFGVQRAQAQVAAVLRPGLPAYGMSLYGVPFYAESVGMRAVGGAMGSDQLIKAFVANGIPVIVSDQVSRTDATRHFRPIDSYDDEAGFFIGSDPYLGPNHQISYAEFDDIWKISANRWVVLYPPAKQPLIDAILGQYGNRALTVQAGLQRAQQRAAQIPNLPWSWLELADMQIDAGDFKDAGPNIEKGMQLGLPFEGHWLELKLQRASGGAA